VLIEVLNEDGTMARRDDLIRFAKKHGFKIGTVADLIKYRLTHEQQEMELDDCGG
jgi:3,4-dihydroxy 2-butanone 4-phosphate synthase/GTP cyclohydrolase II